MQRSQTSPNHPRATSADGSSALPRRLKATTFPFNKGSAASSTTTVLKPSAGNKVPQVKNKTVGVTSFMGAGAMNPTFANSKFFLKKQNRAVTKIQAVVRAFLVQARIFHQQKLEPRLKDLVDCEARKQEELRRVEEQKKEEMEELPLLMMKEQEEAQGIAESLQREIDVIQAENAELKEKNKELKHSNKEIEKEMSTKTKSAFKLEVQKTKLTAENAKLEKDVEWYRERIMDYECGLEHKQQEVQKVLRQQNVYKKYLKNIIKMMEDKAPDAPSSPSKKIDRRKHMLRRSSIQKLPGEEPCFDWATQSYDWSKQQLTVDLAEDKNDDLDQRHHSSQHHSSHHHHRSNKKSSSGTRDLVEEIKRMRKELAPRAA